MCDYVTCFFLIERLPPISTRTYTRILYTTLFQSEQLGLIVARIGHAHERRGQRNAMLGIKRLPVEAEKVVQRIVRYVIALIITEGEEGMIVDVHHVAGLHSPEAYEVGFGADVGEQYDAC